MKKPGYRDTATTKENHRRFVRRVMDSRQVWGLKSSRGWADAESNDHADTTVLLFWSDEPYARRAQSQFPEYAPAAISLFDFLYRWLPEMSGDGVMAGANWTEDLVGIESDPFELRSEIEADLPKDLAEEYKRKYEAELQKVKGSPNQAL